jgi:2-keto-3-deoxy-L-rhamnonate aldolase RhmA
MSDRPTFDLSRLLGGGDCIENAWLTIADPWLAEIVSASRRFTAITLDMQHGLFDQRSAVECIRAIQLHGTAAMVRLSGANRFLTGFLLDAAVSGLILPQTGSAAEARQLVAACQYPPQGQRSYGPTRAALFDRSPAVRPVTFCMIETREGLDCVGEIAAVDGVDGLFVGPGDLGISIGLGPGQDRSEPEFGEALTTIVQAARQAGKALGIHANSAAYAAGKAAEGFQLVTTWVDAVAVKQSIHTAANTFRQSLPQGPGR